MSEDVLFLLEVLIFHSSLVFLEGSINTEWKSVDLPGVSYLQALDRRRTLTRRKEPCIGRRIGEEEPAEYMVSRGYEPRTLQYQ